MLFEVEMDSKPAEHGHEYKTTRRSDDEEEDPFDAMLKKTGCVDEHYAVQECMFESRDWRKCQQQVQRMKVCMQEYEKRKMMNNNSTKQSE